MREILFRGKSDNDEEWKYGDLLQGGYDYDFAIYGKEDKLVIEVIPETVGQYTGLNDKNGKKIFEGDIHQFVVGVSDTHLFAVKYGKYYDFEVSEERYGWHFQNIRTGDCNSFYGDENQYVHIIGNIHDNPELLKGGGEE